MGEQNERKGFDPSGEGNATSPRMVRRLLNAERAASLSWYTGKRKRGGGDVGSLRV